MSRSPRLTVGTVGLCAVLAACSAQEPRAGTTEGRSASPDGPAAPTTPSSPALAALAPVFGDDLAPQEDGSFGLDRWAALEDGPEDVGGPALRVAFPAGSVSPSATREHGSPEGGMQVFLPFTSSARESAHLRFWVRFPEDFEFARGGKLPGLYGGTEVSGGEEPDGTDGFSTRLMWRGEGDAEVYLYAPGESGTSLGRGEWTWRRGVWQCVEQRVELNRPAEDDGSVTVWVDGREAFTEAGMRYRTVEDLRIDGVFFSTFYGGADPSWAPTEDQHADFAAFAVSDERIGCS